jgi:cobyrinic acid a,c-diamide synthase
MRGLVITGTHSGCGKTTITLGILAALSKRRYKVQPFKAGPDFIDTGLHKFVTGRNSRNLDLWMCGRDYVIDCFRKHSVEADIAVVEGVMGMYDGNLSTADLAATIGLPVVLVIDVYGMAESAGAVVKGFAEYSAKVQKCKSAAGVRSPRPYRLANIAGVIFNRVASERHYKRLKDSVQDVPVLGYLPRDLDFKIPQRHLGLVVAEEEPVTKEEIDKLADAILDHIDIELLVRKCESAEARKNKKTIEKDSVNITSDLPNFRTSDLKIAVAYDKAFCFYYEDNLDLLRKEGAEIVTFSPLSGSKIPDDVNALYLGGGYPELYAKELSENRSMLESINNWTSSGRPAYAECGGFMYLTEGVYDFDNVFYPLAGTFPMRTRMTEGRARLGYREVFLKSDSITGKKGDRIRGHEFHYSEIVKRAEERKSGRAEEKKDISPYVPITSELPNFRTSALSGVYSVKDGSGNDIHNEGYKINNTLGSYIHIHFGSNLSIAKTFMDFIKEHHGTYSSCGTRKPQGQCKQS